MPILDDLMSILDHLHWDIETSDTAQPQTFTTLSLTIKIFKYPGHKPYALCVFRCEGVCSHPTKCSEKITVDISSCLGPHKPISNENHEEKNKIDV